MAKLFINIDVPELESAIRFYTGAFDLVVHRRFGNDAAELHGFATEIHLLVKTEGTFPFDQAQECRRYSRHWTPVHLDIVVDSIAEATAKAQQAGARVESEIEIRPWGKIVLMSDPFGNGFCLLQFEGKGY